ncbi:hypothetical protein [Mesobacillus foraminis]|uniref:hypothetical protein n=1 Tax=Mesobacillus foraminis TaxID=279826 RepID=UPI002034CA5C|nr:hypothetical protein [Mesobacillus foraminis]
MEQKSGFGEGPREVYKERENGAFLMGVSFTLGFCPPCLLYFSWPLSQCYDRTVWSGASGGFCNRNILAPIPLHLCYLVSRIGWDTHEKEGQKDWSICSKEGRLLHFDHRGIGNMDIVELDWS